MNEKTPHRRPATFKLDDPGVVVMDPDDTGRPARGTVRITPESDPSLLPVPRVQSAFTAEGEPTDPGFEERCEKFFREFEWYAEALRRARGEGVPY